MTLETLRDLYIAQLKDLYSAEKQLTEAIPKMVKAATNPELKEAFTTHLAETEIHLERLRGIFQDLDLNPGNHVCKAMQGLVEEGNAIGSEHGDPDVIDAGLIAAAQRVEHYEMAGYGCVRTYARTLGEDAALNILQTTLDEEGAVDKKLTEIAERVVNVRANQNVDSVA
ncbi:MAG: ferritin-like domain-containing protein [bacterium]|nr:ferritin-like domain-containing protein [bacterium]